MQQEYIPINVHANFEPLFLVDFATSRAEDIMLCDLSVNMRHGTSTNQDAICSLRGFLQIDVLRFCWCYVNSRIGFMSLH